MAAIEETLQINDKFSATFNHFDDLGQRIASTLERMDSRLEQYGKAQEEAAQKTKTHDDAAKKADASISKLEGTVRGVIAALGGFAAARAFVGLSDQIAQTEARLDAIKGEFADVGQLQDAIFAAAQRSRGSYMDIAATVASLNAQTKGVFNSTGESVRFAELLNKQFAISGTSAAGIQSTMYNLTQALATGVLRGNDLQMVLSNSPAIIQKIGDYMGEDIGKIREMAQQGQITADIVKNAILKYGSEIDAQFEEMPMTFGQAMQKLKNEGVRALQPLSKAFTDFMQSDSFDAIMSSISDGIVLFANIGQVALNGLAAAIEWATQNFDMLIMAIGIVAGAYLAVQIASVGSALASAAAWAMANLPLILIGVLLGAIVASMINAGVTFTQIGQTIGQVFGFIYALGYNAFANLWNVIASFAEFFANVWNDPLAATIQLFTGVFDAILGMVEAVANAIDALLNSNLSGAVAGFRGKLSGWVDANYGDKAVEIKRMANIDTGTTMGDFGDIGANLGSKIDGLGGKIGGLGDSIGGLGDFGSIEIPDYSGSGAGGGAGKKANVGTVDKVKDVKLSDEDLKVYRDLAERRYMANVELQTLAPEINVSIPESAAKNLTSQDVADKLKAILIEQSAAHTAVAHAH